MVGAPSPSMALMELHIAEGLPIHAVLNVYLFIRFYVNRHDWMLFFYPQPDESVILSFFL